VTSKSMSFTVQSYLRIRLLFFPVGQWLVIGLIVVLANSRYICRLPVLNFELPWQLVHRFSYESDMSLSALKCLSDVHTIRFDRCPLFEYRTGSKFSLNKATFTSLTAGRAFVAAALLVCLSCETYKRQPAPDGVTVIMGPITRIRVRYCTLYIPKCIPALFALPHRGLDDCDRLISHGLSGDNLPLWLFSVTVSVGIVCSTTASE
jgi:hypothetical protein